MSLELRSSSTASFSVAVCFFLSLAGCFDSSGNNRSSIDQTDYIETAWVTGPSDVVWPRLDSGYQGAFKDKLGEPDKISGTVWVKSDPVDPDLVAFRVVWYDSSAKKVLGAPLAYVEAQTIAGLTEFGLVIAPTANMQTNARLELHALDAQNQVFDAHILHFHDFKGNALVTGPGGNLESSWEYGEDRPSIPVYRFGPSGNKTCQWDNGWVQVTDMQNEKDDRSDIVIDDNSYPAFEFDCTESLRNTQRAVWWDEAQTEVSTYSALNDALYYATHVYEAFHRYLGRPPWDEKLRLRVHYDSQYKFPFNATWDGAYANFSDNVFDGYGTTSLDVIAHEIGHGFLSHNTPLVRDGKDFPSVIRTIHEAFSDITSVVVKNHVSGRPHWVMGEELKTSRLRYLDQIVTQQGAYQSKLDIDPNSQNPYLSIGMLTYPFYILTQKWGIDRAYGLYLHGAMNCWDLDTTLQSAAECILQSSKTRGDSQQDVIDAFKAVKIRLYEQGSMAHFTVSKKKREIQFNDNSKTTNQIRTWQWYEGDTLISDAENPKWEFEEGGKKVIRLQVTDANGQSDAFTREFDVFESYCKPLNNYGSGIPDRHIKSVEINGQEVVIQDPYQYDYTDQQIMVDTSQSLAIKVVGERKGDALTRSTNWRLWLDADDDGEWHESDELLLAVDKNKDQDYILEIDSIAWPSSLDEGPLRLRLVADYVAIDPCRSMKDVTKDFLLTPIN